MQQHMHTVIKRECHKCLLNKNWKHQVMDGELGKTLQKRGHISCFSRKAGILPGGVPTGKNILGKGTELILDITFDSGSWGLCRAAHTLPCSLKTTCCPLGVRSAGIRHKASWLMWKSQPWLRPGSEALVILWANWALFLYLCPLTSLYDDSEVFWIISYWQGHLWNDSLKIF